MRDRPASTARSTGGGSGGVMTEVGCFRGRVGCRGRVAGVATESAKWTLVVSASCSKVRGVYQTAIVEAYGLLDDARVTRVLAVHGVTWSEWDQWMGTPVAADLYAEMASMTSTEQSLVLLPRLRRLGWAPETVDAVSRNVNISFPFMALYDSLGRWSRRLGVRAPAYAGAGFTVAEAEADLESDSPASAHALAMLVALSSSQGGTEQRLTTGMPTSFLIATARL